jgi:hypothetical protein
LRLVVSFSCTPSLIADRQHPVSDLVVIAKLGGGWSTCGLYRAGLSYSVNEKKSSANTLGGIWMIIGSPPISGQPAL